MHEQSHATEAWITNDAVVLGILMVILVVVFKTSSATSGFWKKFYTYVPAILLCYFLPGLLNTAGIISGDDSELYFVSSRFLLPASLVLFTLSIDLKEVLRLGPKAVIMFFTGAFGIVLGGPLAILIVSAFNPEVVGGQGPEEVWRGLATIAGSWIGGGANQTAMKEVFGASNDLFSKTVAVDVIVANIWMGFLLFGAGRSKAVDKLFKADSSSIEEVKEKIENYQASVRKIPTLTDTMIVLGVAFGFVAVSHFFADIIGPFFAENFPHLAKYSLTSKFFWLVVIATTLGLASSFNPKVRALEGVGASRLASVFLYILVTAVGTHMNLLAIFENPGLFVVGIIWMLVHVGLMLGVGKLIRAPFFFIAVGSQANIGGAASAPVVAAAFHPSLAPVGVLLAVLGYAFGTYGAVWCGILMQGVSPG